MNSALAKDDTEARVNSTLWWTFINVFAFEALFEKTELGRGRWWLDYFYEPNAVSFFAGRWSIGLSWRLGCSLRDARKRLAYMRLDVRAWLNGGQYDF